VIGSQHKEDQVIQSPHSLQLITCSD